MHDCPDCGQACDCDGDDVWESGSVTDDGCQHICDPSDFSDGQDDFESIGYAGLDETEPPCSECGGWHIARRCPRCRMLVCGGCCCDDEDDE